jgi:2-polyprenyl-3-methyl-5-hydroxy-6-metoxy-1,4-benzoquinol methylase
MLTDRTLMTLKRVKRRADSALMARRKRKVLSAGDAPARWYDAAYSKTSEYRNHWSESTYLPVWDAICARVGEGSSVLEVGCGPGQLARMLHDKGILASYVGFDFSAKAVNMAREASPEITFEVADAFTTDLFASVNYDTVICTEVLEHIHDDLAVLSRIPSGVHVLATVPDFDWDSHVRFFNNAAEVTARYAEMFLSLEISSHFHTGDPHGHNGTFFLIDGRKV